MSEPSWLHDGGRYVWRPYCQHQVSLPPVPVVGARGCRLMLADGRELVDGIASWWTAAHGYGHPHIAARVSEQLHRLPHIAFGGLAHEAAYTLAARLATLFPAPLSRVFFADSGSVAVEVAVKMALQSFHNRGRPRRSVVCFDGAYHGDTFAMMSLSDPVDGIHRAFSGSGLQAFHFPVPHPSDDRAFEKSFARIADDVACVIIEPLVQCAGGMRFHDVEALRRLRRACDAHGVWLVFDEIATGFFRTGARFALDHARVTPDVVVLGKALTGGTVPLAATVASDALFAAFLDEDPSKALQHGPTYMGNALACAAAHASLDLFAQSQFGARVSDLETRMRARLSTLRGRPGVVDVRCKGGVGVVEMEPGTAPPSHAFIERGAFLRPLRLRRADVVYLMPPLVIESDDLEVLFAAIEGALAGS
jgi:adenosylmethionine-8-amino-7-oxononanoate aminotransferase